MLKPATFSTIVAGEETIMRKKVLAAICLMTSGHASATNYVVGDICPTCSLQTPVPDPITQSTLVRWSGEERWFVLAQKFVEEGDTVTICNASWCVKYVRGSGQTWFDGLATRKILHVSGGKPCTPHDPPHGSGSGGFGGGQGNVGGTVTVGPLLRGGKSPYGETRAPMMRLCM